MKTAIELDPSQLLGFKLEVHARTTTSSKTGAKSGDKKSPVLGSKQGAKEGNKPAGLIGMKAGAKVGNKDL